MMGKRKPKNKLSKITITTVGIVDNPAIEREFLIWKRQEVNNDMDDVDKRATEAERKAQQARAKKYGISVKEILRHGKRPSRYRRAFTQISCIRAAVNKSGSGETYQDLRYFDRQWCTHT